MRRIHAPRTFAEKPRAKAMADTPTAREYLHEGIGVVEKVEYGGGKDGE